MIPNIARHAFLRVHTQGEVGITSSASSQSKHVQAASLAPLSLQEWPHSTRIALQLV